MLGLEDQIKFGIFDQRTKYCDGILGMTIGNMNTK